MKKFFSSFFSLTLVFSFLFTSQVSAATVMAKNNVPKIAQSESSAEFLKIITDGKDTFADVSRVDVKELLGKIQNKNGIAVDLDSNGKFGVINVKGEKIPVFISTETSSVKAIRKALKETKKTYKERIKEEKNNEFTSSPQNSDSTFSTLSTTPSFTKSGTTLKLDVSTDGQQFWYTEYRSYEDPDFSDSEDVFWLRADHEPQPEEKLFRFNATWGANGDLLDPKPESKNNVQATIQWSIPPSITMGTSLSAEDTDDVKTTIDVSSDVATWEVTNKNFSGFDMTMNDFHFTHGVQIESPTSNDGFRMNVDYSRMTNVYTTKSWSDEIIFYESANNLTFKD